MAAPIGLIAGLGRFPVLLARAARASGRALVGVGLQGLAEEGLGEELDGFLWLRLGEVERMMAFFRDNGVRELVMVGKVPKTVLWKRPELVQLDPTALAALSGLADRRDDALLGAVAELLESHGFRVLGQAELAPSLFAAEGVLGSVAPTSDQLADVRFGWPIAKSIGALDVGQTVVVQGLAVLALEAVEGTDETVRRGCALGRPGATVIKVAKPAQDMRFDVPTIGPATLRTLAQGQAGTLAVESGRTVVLDREEVVALADAHGITLLGMPEGGALPALERDG